MTTFYATQQTGVADGTQVPALRADGRQVGAKKAVTVATKPTAAATAANDLIYLGKLRQGEMITDIKLVSDTSYGAVTVSIGTLTTPNKYVDAKTMTVTDVPTTIGPKASALSAGPASADEDLYAKVSGVVAAAVVSSFIVETVGVR